MTTSEATEPGLVPLSRESVRQRNKPVGALPAFRGVDIESANEASRQSVRNTRPHNTTKTHNTNWNVWLRYCKEENISPMLGEVATLVGFVSWMYDQGFAYSSALQNLSGTRVCLREQGIELSSHDAKAVTDAMHHYQRTVALDGELRGRGKARPISVEELHQVCSGFPDTLAGRRNRALWVIGFGTGCRRSELSGLLLSDVGIHPKGLLVRVRWSKTKQPRHVTVTPAQDPEIDPVRAWKDWLESTGMDQVPSQHGHLYPAFQQVNRHGSLVGSALSARAIQELITRTAASAGVPGHITAHSLRAGMATAARQAGHDMLAICRQGGWVDGSSAVHGYVHTVNRWEECALKGVW